MQEDIGEGRLCASVYSPDGTTKTIVRYLDLSDLLSSICELYYSSSDPVDHSSGVFYDCEVSHSSLIVYLCAHHAS